ncbi:restriction endonuclease subunit S [Micromonospora aurantiaca]|uniref:Restriction endonuclease subunit S n=1 Tax=Micromonospora aurantiaca (nom. illeg.) TaxID=47850 RepID=A0A6N3K595_9ACTN|nr:restriction endonuclease subunit S [Micromonospora aurantiaca]AXH93548.1 restriction endonuclease subunit S [Micromonospora aurantiaca]
MEPLISSTPANWQHRRLDEICTVQAGPGGSLLKAADRVAFGTPVVNTTDITDGRITPTPTYMVSRDKARSLDRYELAEGDILLARLRATTSHAVVTEAESRWLMGSSTIRICVTAAARSALLPHYLSCYLRHPSVHEFLTRQIQQGVVPSLTKEVVSRLPLALPPLEIQNSVVEVAAAVQDKIQAHEQVIHAARQLRDALIPQLVSGELTAL